MKSHRTKYFKIMSSSPLISKFNGAGSTLQTRVMRFAVNTSIRATEDVGGALLALVFCYHEPDGNGLMTASRLQIETGV